MSDTQEQVVAETTKLVDVTDKLNSSLIKMIDGLEDGAAFLGAEIPEYINQLLMWNLLESLVKCLVGIVIPVLFFLGYKLFWNTSEDWKDRDGTNILRGILAVIGVPFVIALMAETVNLEWLQIWIAPKVWLVEYVVTLTK